VSEPDHSTIADALFKARDLKGALSLSPQSAETISRLSLLLIAAEDWYSLAFWATREMAIRPDLEAKYRHALALTRINRPIAALQSLRRLTAIVPASPAIWSLIGEARASTGKTDDALRAVGRANALAPEHPGVFTHLLGLSARIGPAEAVLRRFERHCRKPPPTAEAAIILADLLIAVSRERDAIHMLLMGGAAASTIAKAADCLSRAAGLARSGGDLVCSRMALRRLLALAPEDSQSASNLNEVMRAEAPRIALAWARRALASEPLSADALSNLSLSQQSLLEFGVAERPLRQAIAANPQHVATLANLSYLTYIDGQFESAEWWARRSLAIESRNQDLFLNLCFALLGQGKVVEGFALHEMRFTTPGEVPRIGARILKPRWSGEPLAGRSLFVWMEQGLGDHFYYARYLAMLPTDERILVECEPRLVDLYRRSFPSFTILGFRPTVEDTLDGHAVDLQIPLASLPLVYLGATRQAIAAFAAGTPWPVRPFLKADPGKTHGWTTALARKDGRLRIAVSWRGGNLAALNAPHYMSAGHMCALFQDLPVTIVNVQYAWNATEVEMMEKALPGFVHPPIDLRDDLDDVAAIIASCDLLITAHTAVLYLGAGLGVPVWSFLTGRSWSNHGQERNPLLPNIRQFPRRLSETWDEIIAQLRSALVNALAQNGAEKRRPDDPCLHIDDASE